MAKLETWLESELQGLPEVRQLPGGTFTQDNKANRIGVEVTDGGAAAALSGTVSAKVIRADGQTVTVSGSRSGNKAWADLTEACYAVQGRIQVCIKLTDGDTVTTLGGCEGTVIRSRTT